MTYVSTADVADEMLADHQRDCDEPDCECREGDE